MIDNEDRKHIEKLINKKKIIDSKLLSSSFGINCFKITIRKTRSYYKVL